MPVSREFGGKTYVYEGGSTYKGRCEFEKRKLQKEGYLCRITEENDPVMGKYFLWIRKKSGGCV